MHSQFAQSHIILCRMLQIHYTQCWRHVLETNNNACSWLSLILYQTTKLQLWKNVLSLGVKTLQTAIHQALPWPGDKLNSIKKQHPTYWIPNHLLVLLWLNHYFHFLKCENQYFRWDTLHAYRNRMQPSFTRGELKQCIMSDRRTSRFRVWTYPDRSKHNLAPGRVAGLLTKHAVFKKTCIGPHGRITRRMDFLASWMP